MQITKILPLILFLAASALSQTLPDISNYRVVATANNGALGAFLNYKEVTRDGDYAKFTALLSPIIEVRDNTPLLDPTNFLLTDFTVNCKSNAFAINRNRGISGGKVFDNVVEPNTNVAEDGTLAFRVIRAACEGPKLKNAKGKDGKF